MERGGEKRGENQGRKLAPGRGEGKGVRHPDQSIVKPRIAQEVEQVTIRAKEDVQAALKPVAFRVLPRRGLASGHLALLEECDPVAGVGQIFRRGQTCQSRSGDEHSCRLGAAVLRKSVDMPYVCS